jgi:hypothetical protein
LAKRLGRYARIRNTPKQAFNLREESRPYGDFHWPMGNPKYDPSEFVRFSAVATSDGKTLEIRQGYDSPILMVGSSFIAYPAMERGGSIPHYLAYETGITPDILYRSGSDQSIPRSVAHEGEKFLKNRVVCIFPFVPLTAYKRLALPPLIDPAKAVETLLATYVGSGLHKQLEPAAKKSKHAFSYAPDGNLIVRPANKVQGFAGSIKLRLPEQISAYSSFLVEVDFEGKDYAYIKAKYSGQTDSIQRSPSQATSEDYFVFKSDHLRVVDFEFADKIYNENPTIIKAIRVFGVQQ